MAQRVLIRADTVRISRPGVDVSFAAEKDLLLSLNARNAQVIQRGFIPMPAGTETAPFSGVSVYNFTIGFPAQQSTPDLWASIITGGNTDSSQLLSNFPPTMETTFGTSSASIRFVGSNGSNAGSASYSGLIYALYRKRLDG